jgi:hypothetical protein
VPVLAFGENECYKRGQLVPGSLADRMQRATKKVGHAGCRPHSVHAMPTRHTGRQPCEGWARAACCRFVGSPCRVATAGAS